MTHLPELSRQSTLQPCVMQVVRVSGTIRKAEEEAIRRAKAAILKAREEGHDSDSSALNAVLGSAQREVEPKQLGKVDGLIMGIEDDDEDDSDDQGSMGRR